MRMRKHNISVWHARRLIESGQPLRVSKSVIPEFESVMRGYDRFFRDEVASVIPHVLEQAHLTFEDKGAIDRALSHCEMGIEFADAFCSLESEAWCCSIPGKNRPAKRATQPIALILVLHTGRLLRASHQTAGTPTGTTKLFAVRTLGSPAGSDRAPRRSAVRGCAARRAL